MNSETFHWKFLPLPPWCGSDTYQLKLYKATLSWQELSASGSRIAICHTKISTIITSQILFLYVVCLLQPPSSNFHFRIFSRWGTIIHFRSSSVRKCSNASRSRNFCTFLRGNGCSKIFLSLFLNSFLTNLKNYPWLHSFNFQSFTNNTSSLSTFYSQDSSKHAWEKIYIWQAFKVPWHPTIPNNVWAWFVFLKPHAHKC